MSHEIESRVAARLHALREECASVIAEIASEYDQKLLEVERRLRDEHDAKLQGFMAGLRMGQAEPDVVIDAKHLRTGRLDA